MSDIRLQTRISLSPSPFDEKMSVLPGRGGLQEWIMAADFKFWQVQFSAYVGMALPHQVTATVTVCLREPEGETRKYENKLKRALEMLKMCFSHP